MKIDVRTKLLLCVTISVLTTSSNGQGLFLYADSILAAIPILFLLFRKKFLPVLYYLIFYAVSFLMPLLALDKIPMFINVFVIGILTVIRKFLPGMSMFAYLFATTNASEFIAALDKMHFPRFLTIPISVMFRMFPSIKEEYRYIKDAMKLRSVGGIKNPISFLEFRLVPLITAILNIGNDLSVASLTRGLDRKNKRTLVFDLKFHFCDFVLMFLCLCFVAGYGILFFTRKG